MFNQKNTIMKKTLFKSISMIMAFTFLFVQTQVYAHAPLMDEIDYVPSVDQSIFNLDEANLEIAMADLNQLDSYLLQHPEATYQDVVKDNASLVANVSAIAAPAGENNGPLGIPSFLWGCVFGVIGVLLVYLMTDNNMDETKKALWGCFTGTAVFVLLNFVVFAGASAAASSY